MVGMLLEAQGKGVEAEKQYQQTLAVDPHAAVAANNLAFIYLSSNRNVDEALQLAQTAQQQLPNEAHVSDTVGSAYLKKDMLPSAIEQFEAAVKAAPNDPVIQTHLGLAYMQAGDWEKAKRTLTKALSAKGDFEGAAEARKALTTMGA